MYVKICGLSTIESARVALDAGADAVGVVVSRRSRRTVSADIGREIAGFVGGAADVVLVVDELPAAEAAAVASGIGADVIQLHGTGYRPDDVAAVAVPVFASGARPPSPRPARSRSDPGARRPSSWTRPTPVPAAAGTSPCSRADR